MRILYIILLLLWSVGSWWYYTCRIKHACWEAHATTTTTIPSLKTDKPLLFRWASFNIPLDSGFPDLKESILAANEESKILEITGYSFPSEVPNSDSYQLGIARATEVKKLLLEQIPEDRIRILSALLPAEEVPKDSLVKAIQYRWVDKEVQLPEKEAVQEAPIIETDSEGTASAEAPSILSEVNQGNSFVKHFPYDQTQISEELSVFLDELAARLIRENKKVLIRGHTDSVGDKELNFKIGLRYAKKVRDQLKKRKVPYNKIETTSDGEETPIADNKTKEGRRLNRRVEIFIKE